ncbi:putative nucleotidyltransferase substrate binding domain-containing protein [Mycolicibacterium sp. HS_4_1]
MSSADFGVDAVLAAIHAADGEGALRSGIEQGLQAVRAAARASTPAVDVAASWSHMLRSGVAAAVRLTSTNLPWSWFVSGSVARGEAVSGSDVETLVMIEDDADQDEALTAAAAVHAVLERSGVRADANGVLASRPRFCRSANAWSDGITHWTSDPRADRGVVMTGVLADSRAVHLADSTLAEDLLRAQVVRAAGHHYPARQYLLQDATMLRATFPSRLRMLTNQSDTVDLKLAAIDPIVKIARWAALSAGATGLSTPSRLDAAGAANVLDADDVSSLRECFTVLLRFRWTSRAGTDQVVLSELPPQERAMLRSVAREVAGISRKLAFLASTSAFR